MPRGTTVAAACHHGCHQVTQEPPRAVACHGTSTAPRTSRQACKPCVQDTKCNARPLRWATPNSCSIHRHATGIQLPQKDNPGRPHAQLHVKPLLQEQQPQHYIRTRRQQQCTYAMHWVTTVMRHARPCRCDWSGWTRARWMRAVGCAGMSMAGASDIPPPRRTALFNPPTMLMLMLPTGARPCS